jgi:putative ATPase
MDLFEDQYQTDLKSQAPLAERMRPEKLDDFVGQEEIIGPGTLLRQAIQADDLPSMIFWGPPGSGKTTLAMVIANLTRSNFIRLSGVTAGRDDLRAAIAEAENKRKFNQRRTILFIDEIHRWNKAQQDGLLPFVEQGIITLIGATTENPSFEVISPLLSRARVYILKSLSPASLKIIIQRALQDEKFGLKKYQVTIEPAAEIF